MDSEPHLKYKFLGTMDGNNSLKLVDTPFPPGLRPDNRQSTPLHWITPEQVDIYKDKVAIAQAKVCNINIFNTILALTGDFQRRKKTTVLPGTAATAAPLAPPMSATASGSAKQRVTWREPQPG
jgi:hypothetical protein